MESRTENFDFNEDGDSIVGWDEIHSWQVKVNNTRNLPIKVEIKRYIRLNYWDMETVEGDVTAEKHDAWRERFELELQPRTEKVFSYRVRTYHGTRMSSRIVRK